MFTSVLTIKNVYYIRESVTLQHLPTYLLSRRIHGSHLFAIYCLNLITYCIIKCFPILNLTLVQSFSLGFVLTTDGSIVDLFSFFLFNNILSSTFLILLFLFYFSPSFSFLFFPFHS
ncbi:uncharacterized protein BX663DRAFT_82185 [Cokeromyces recurvatus]|uniref:uncharacterized protein n=1 Tax=Cokeromyces recurvatus TaxID=90255 RepID=UPI00221FA9EC|nr:uncharacterized protein BX663DRAFT_82185 [Cokeromyces recurvatus]KAI7902111.1 hypothetical protein BX663DRAFT_82185 [Cokeromyces recurvatus]